ncbi:hypothetical protein GCM10007857_07690 [Bradyrhizobium iriomotense]|uniref:Helix-turn-helix domain-containing protein n=1 Tax=Bradyrhizobium iriomotense TaxID=441950 RepID=A0ABQ6APL9_9BRAD|nr:hypothetical protein GCM10007857_07690 [Bradyrhizobium iriomotense]
MLDKGTLGEVIQALDLVGAASLKGHALREARDLDRHLVLDAGYRVFAAWPLALDSILDGLLARSGIGPGKWGAAAAYGHFHTGLNELRNGPIAAALKERTRRHAIANGVAISRTVFGVAQTAKDLCSIKDAASRLGLGFDRARRELAHRGLVPARTRRGTPVVIPQTAVDNLISERLGTVKIKQAAQDLRIGRTQARRLVAAGIIERRGALRRSDIDGLLQKLSSRAPTHIGRDGVPLPRACRSARLPIEAAVAAILQGRASLAGYRSGRGLEGIYARISDLRALGKDHRDAMTIEDAARTLKLKWETVKKLTQLRLIRAGNAGIPRAAIEAFQADFVAGAHLAQAAGLRPRTLMKVMSKAGICPVVAPPRCRQVFYRREEILNASQFRSKHPLVHSAALRNRAG